jgi:hypothetical protein
MQRIIASATVALALSLVAAGCHNHTTRHVDLRAVPAHVTWRAYEGVEIPFGSDGRRNETTATGFDATPQGAALAAIVHTVRMSVAPDDQWTEIAAAEIAPGTGKDDWAMSRLLVSITRPVDPAKAPRIVGYRITDFVEHSHAAVTVYSRYPDKSMTANLARVVWTGSDWKLQLPDPKATAPVVQAVNGLPRDAVRLEVGR